MHLSLLHICLPSISSFLPSLLSLSPAVHLAWSIAVLYFPLNHSFVEETELVFLEHSHSLNCILGCTLISVSVFHTSFLVVEYTAAL